MRRPNNKVTRTICLFGLGFFSQLCHIPIRNDWIRRNILGDKGLCLGNSCGEEPLQGPGCAGEGAAAPGELWAEGSRQPGAQVGETISPGSRGECAKSVATQRVLSSDFKKPERKICSVRRKGLEELVIRLCHFCSILLNPLNSFMYVYMGVYSSS